MSYQETAWQEIARVKAYTYHPPVNADQNARYVAIISTANVLAKRFNHSCPTSRELSLAHTKLEEAVMWANAAIARNESKE